jgi:DNA polymerase III delta subunit
MPRTLIVARDPLVAEEAALARLPAGVEIRRWHANELSLDLIFAQLGSSDLFATRQSFLYLNVLDIKLKKAEGERLDSILAHMPPEIDVACTQVFTDLAYRDEERMLKGADLARWSKGAKVEDLRRVSDANQAPRWLLDRAAKQHGLKLTPQQAQRLLAITGGKLSLAEGELLKLSMLKTSSGLESMSDEQIEEVVSVSPAAQYWELVDSIMLGNSDAIQRLRIWYSLSSEDEIFGLLAILKQRFLGMRALALGLPVQPPFLAQQLQKLRNSWPPQRVIAATEMFAELDFSLKSGLIPGHTTKDAKLSALEVFTRMLTAER